MHVLIIEDEERIARSIQKGLENERFVVDIAHDGEVGRDLALSEPFDVIILDRMLPGIDGVALCKDLRSAQNHTPILMLTAKSQTEDKIEGLNCGADDYLTKPFSFDELVARIRALSRRPKKTYGSKITVRDVTIDLTTYQVVKNGKPVVLSKKEFMLLEYLMRNKGKIVSKDQIITHVWAFEDDVLPNTVEVFIGALRKKLGDTFISTLRGFGYRVGDTEHVS